MLSRNILTRITIQSSCRMLGIDPLKSKWMFGSGTCLQLSTFKSNLSCDKMYPDSNMDYLRNKQENHNGTSGTETFSGNIPIDQLQIRHSRSSGPGGQNVNKVNSKVEIRLHLDSANWIPDWIKPRLIEQEQNRITKNGFLVIKSDMTRKQMLNQADCLNKLRNMIYQASVLPKEPTEEEIKKREQRMMKAKAEVLREKKRKSLLKKSRCNLEL